jgi:hypothetical protein
MMDMIIPDLSSRKVAANPIGFETLSKFGIEVINTNNPETNNTTLPCNNGLVAMNSPPIPKEEAKDVINIVQKGDSAVGVSNANDSNKLEF